MKQIYHPYTLWEDYKNGMWRSVPKTEEPSMLNDAIKFTGDYKKYVKAMLRVINEWPITCEHNLSDELINHRAFIGHCAVCLELNIPEYITRMAWGYLSNMQQDQANGEADNAYKLWLSKHERELCQKQNLEFQF